MLGTFILSIILVGVLTYWSCVGDSEISKKEERPTSQTWHCGVTIDDVNGHGVTKAVHCDTTKKAYLLNMYDGIIEIPYQS